MGRDNIRNAEDGISFNMHGYGENPEDTVEATNLPMLNLI